MKPIVPPGGFAGFAQMTQASQRALSSGLGRAVGAVTRRRSSKKKAASSSSSSSRSRKRAKSSRKRTKLVKGSAAAKRYMARLRQMRKK